jgi:hypothetical protein
LAATTHLGTIVALEAILEKYISLNNEKAFLCAAAKMPSSLTE